MTNSTALVPNSLDKVEDNSFDAFSDVGQVDPFELKKDHLATQLAGLMSFCKKNRSEMAADLGWEKSRVTKVLSGKQNLTVKSIWEFSSCLGFEFDISFRSPVALPPKQPWQIRADTFLQVIGRRFSDRLSLKSFPIIEIQSADEVAADMSAGKYKNFYISNVAGGVESFMTKVTLPNVGTLIQANSSFEMRVTPQRVDLLTLTTSEEK